MAASEQEALTRDALTWLRTDADSIPRARAALRRAAELGGGEATAKLAHFAAAGFGRPADWDESLDLLQRAAELGWTQAERELRLLARGHGDSPKAMRAAVDLRAWIAPRPTQTVSTSPRIRTALNFMSAEECAWLIEAARARLAPAEVYDLRKEGSEVVSARSNSTADFPALEIDVVQVLLRNRIAHTIGLPVVNFEPAAVLHYAPGQQFEPHHDFLDPRFPGPAADVQARGQRVATFLVYLNEAFEGGETDFPKIGYRFKGKTGDALVFANVDPKLQPDFNTRHAGLPPTSGEKWLLSQWIRDLVSR